MNKESILKIVDKALEMGESERHFASINLSTNSNTFPICISIHNLNKNGRPDGIVSHRYVSNVDSYEILSDWLENWITTIREERKST